MPEKENQIMILADKIIQLRTPPSPAPSRSPPAFPSADSESPSNSPCLCRRRTLSGLHTPIHAGKGESDYDIGRQNYSVKEEGRMVSGGACRAAGSLKRIGR